MILSSKRIKKGADQTSRMRRLVCTFVVLKPPKTGFLASRPIFNLTNSADTDEMLPYAAFHQDLHCLPFNLLQGTRMRQVKDICIHFDRRAKEFENRRKG